MTMAETAPDASCVWLYAVTRDAPPSEKAVPGVAGEKVSALQEAGLTALAGAVPESEFGQPAVRHNLENLDWLAAVARAHDAVVRSAMGEGAAAVPVRLVTLFSEETSVRSLLRERGTDFEAALQRLDGRTEWGVKVFGDPAAAPGTGESASDDTGEANPGTSYLLRRRNARAERERAVRAATEHGERLHARLARLSVASRHHALGGAVAREGTGTLLLNGAYLVDDRDFVAFRDAVGAETGDAGVRVELTGPWPPYSFASVPGLTDA
jgi:hypothetical protein